MGAYLQQLHDERKARLVRLGMAAACRPPQEVAPQQEPECPPPQEVAPQQEPECPPPVVAFPKPEPDAPLIERGPPMRNIVAAVSEHYGVSVLDIVSHRRTARVVIPRQVACYLARTMTLLSLPQIGRKIGNRDHTTVMHAVGKIERLLPQVQPDLDAIKKRLRA